MEIGCILKRLRKKQRINQADLAKYLLVSRPTYLRYEQNTIEIPLSKLFEVAKFYKLDIVELIRLIEMENNRKNVSFNSLEMGENVLTAQAV